MKRMFMMLALAGLLVVALSLSAVSAFAAPKPCEPGAPGCKTLEGKNDKFTQTQRGNFNEGTKETNVCTDPCPPGQFK